MGSQIEECFGAGLTLRVVVCSGIRGVSSAPFSLEEAGSQRSRNCSHLPGRANVEFFVIVALPAMRTPRT